MNRIECLTQLEKELKDLGYELIAFKTRDGVIEANFTNKELNKYTLYIPYRYLSSKQLHDAIRRCVSE